jgi:outer membrane receptor protein involved in Fe transport
MRRWRTRAIAAALGGLVWSGAAAAQTTGGIEGIVRDPAGGPLPSADVLVSGPSLQGARAVRTDSDGRFRLPALPPGSYTVTAALAGFHPETKTIVVSVSGRASADFSLQPAVQEAVAVIGEASRIDLTTTTGGTKYAAPVIANLPVDRNYADIARSNPGVATDQGETQGRALGLTIYGATSAENQWLVDGVNTTNISKGLQGKAIANEFVQEVEVKTGAYSAEYGGALGGVVNVVTKSGGNEFHGGGFVYYDSSTTAADQIFTSQDYLAASMRWADYQRLDAGVDLGGYILKDRLWFFGAYDRVTLDGDVSRVEPSTLVSTDDRFPLNSTDNLYAGKLTWNIATSTSVVASVFADPSTSSGASGTDPRQDQRLGRFEDTAIVNPNPSTWYSDRQLGGTDFGLRLTQLLGSMGLVTLQASRHQDGNSLAADEQVRTVDLRCTGQPPGTPDSPCQPPDVPNLVTGGFGVIDGPLDHNVSFRNQLRADLTLYAGRHEIQAGASYEYGGSDASYSVTGGQEVLVRNEFGQTYYDHFFPVRSLNDLTPVVGVKFRAKARSFGAYVQDTWRAAAGLTLSLGLRWDTEDLLSYQGATVLSLQNEWQPRLGVVWDPWNDGRTKIYAFGGRFYYSLPTIGTAVAFHNFAVVHTYNFDPISIEQDPNVVNHETPWCEFGCGATGEGTDRFDSVDQGLKGSYQDEYSLGVERAIDATLTVGLKATYRTLGNAIENRCDFDAGVPGVNATDCAIINPGSGEKFAKGDAPVCNGLDDPYYACTAAGPATPAASRLYRGIELVARKSVGDKLWLQASYVYSSLRGNYDGAVNEAFQNTTPGLNQDFDWPYYWHEAYGSLFLDRPHRFRFDGYWVTPPGLTLGLQAFAASGPPFDQIGYVGYVGAMTYLVPRGSAGRLPTEWDANLSLSYPIQFGPATVTLVAYAFNVFNHQTPTSQNPFWTLGEADGYPNTIYDPDQEPHNEDYGKYTGRQAPRYFRGAVRVSF